MLHGALLDIGFLVELQHVARPTMLDGLWRHNSPLVALDDVGPLVVLHAIGAPEAGDNDEHVLQREQRVELLMDGVGRGIGGEDTVDDEVGRVRPDAARCDGRAEYVGDASNNAQT